mmetsp:Transcript_25187/g.72845  ORF Transcript_25187/g.72845 Transcript_25187/m.72845 type:complete len:424 (-) Transcript_25187:981-2252(-)
MQRARTLAGRRAWVDVLAITGDLLHGRTSPHGRWYRILSGEEPVAAAASASSSAGGGGGGGSGDSKTAQDEEEQTEQSETNELLRLRLTAYLRLRKTVDLAREVERLNLLDEEDEDDDDNDTENDANNNATRDDTSARKRRVGGLPLWVDMTVTILAATSLLYTDPGNPQRCLDALYRIRVEIVNTGLRKGGGGNVVKTKALPYLNRVDVAIANVHVRRKECRLALAALDGIVDHIGGAVGLEVERRLRLAARTNKDEDDDDRTKICEWLTAALTGAARIGARLHARSNRPSVLGVQTLNQACASRLEKVNLMNAYVENRYLRVKYFHETAMYVVLESSIAAWHALCYAIQLITTCRSTCTSRYTTDTTRYRNYQASFNSSTSTLGRREKSGISRWKSWGLVISTAPSGTGASMADSCCFAQT